MNVLIGTVLSLFIATSNAFVVTPAVRRCSVAVYAEDNKAVSMVTGEDLELLLQNMEQPLVVDAYATWWYVPNMNCCLRYFASFCKSSYSSVCIFRAFYFPSLSLSLFFFFTAAPVYLWPPNSSKPRKN